MALNNNEKHDNEKLIMGFLNDELDDNEKMLLVKKLGGNPDLATEVGTMQKTWHMLGQIKSPNPSVAMHDKFQAMLTDFKQQESNKQTAQIGKRFLNFLENLWPTHIASKSLVSAMLIFTIFSAGYWASTTKSYDSLIATQNVKIKTLQAEMMLTLIDEKSPLSRLKAVSISHELNDETNTQVISALIKTLQEDDNDNVRLASLEALLPYANDPQVRLGLVASIKFQSSPLVQMALAEAMVALQEKTSIGPLKDLIENENTPDEIKDKIQESIDILI